MGGTTQILWICGFKVEFHKTTLLSWNPRAGNSRYGFMWPGGRETENGVAFCEFYIFLSLLKSSQFFVWPVGTVLLWTWSSVGELVFVQIFIRLFNFVCAGSFFVSVRGLSLVGVSRGTLAVMHRLLVAVASLAKKHRLYGTRASGVAALRLSNTGLVALRLSSRA